MTLSLKMNDTFLDFLTSSDTFVDLTHGLREVDGGVGA